MCSSAARASGEMMFVGSLDSCWRSSRNLKKRCVIPPDASRTTRRSDSAMASPSNWPSSRKSSVCPHWLMPIDAHRSPPFRCDQMLTVAVVDRKVRVVAGEDPRVVAARRFLLERRRQLGVARDVVRDAGHAARQLARREVAGAALGRRDDVLERRLPVRVEHDDRVRLQPVEHLRPHPPQARDEADLLAVVELLADVLGQHDGGHVGDEPGPDDLTHGGLHPANRSSTPSPPNRPSNRFPT